MNIYNLKRIVLFFTALLLISYPTGCSDSKEIDTLAFVTGIGFDYSGDEEQPLEFSAQIAKVSSLGGEPDTSEPYIVKSVKANHIYQAMENLRFSLSRTPFFQHHQVIVIGREQAEKGMKKYLEELIKHREIRMESIFLVSSDKATDFLDAETPLNKISSLGISSMMSQNVFGQVEIENEFLSFMSKTLDYGKTALVPIVELIDHKDEGKKQSISIAGVAVFKDGAMIHELSRDDYIGCVIITNELSKGAIEISGDWGKAGLLINKSTRTSRPHLDNSGKITYKADVDIRLSIGYLEIKDEKIDLENSKELEKIIIDELGGKIQRSFELSKQIEADFFEISKDVSKFYPKAWKNLKDDWYKHYKDVVLEPHIEISGIEKIGELPEISK